MMRCTRQSYLHDIFPTKAYGRGSRKNQYRIHHRTGFEKAFRLSHILTPKKTLHTHCTISQCIKGPEQQICSTCYRRYQAPPTVKRRSKQADTHNHVANGYVMGRKRTLHVCCTALRLQTHLREQKSADIGHGEVNSWVPVRDGGGGEEEEEGHGKA